MYHWAEIRALFYSKMFNILMRVSYINTCLQHQFQYCSPFTFKSAYPLAKDSIFSLKLKNLSALQNQTPD